MPKKREKKVFSSFSSAGFIGRVQPTSSLPSSLSSFQLKLLKGYNEQINYQRPCTQQRPSDSRRRKRRNKTYLILLYFCKTRSSSCSFRAVNLFLPSEQKRSVVSFENFLSVFLLFALKKTAQSFINPSRWFWPCWLTLSKGDKTKGNCRKSEKKENDRAARREIEMNV